MKHRYFSVFFVLMTVFFSCTNNKSGLKRKTDIEKWENYSFKSVEWKATDPDSLKRAAAKVKAYGEEIKSDFWKAKGNFMFGDYYYRTGKFDTALPYVRKALELALQANDSITVSSSYILLGISYFNLGRLNESELELYKGLQYALNLKDTTRLMHCYTTLGTLNRDLEDFEKASMYISKALFLAELKKELQVIAFSKRDLAVVLAERNDSSNVLSYLRQAAGIFHQLADTSEEAEIDIEFGFYYYHKNPDSALYYFEKARNTFSKLGDEEMVQVANHNIAGFYYNQGNYKEAGEVFEKTYRNSLRVGDLTGQSKGIISWIATALKTQNVKLADSLLQLGYKISAQRKNPSLELDLLQAEIDLQKLKGKTQENGRFYEKQLEIKDSLEVSRNKEITRLIHNQLENEQKDHEIEILRYASIQQKTLARIQRNLMILMGIFFLVSLVLIGIIVRYYRRNLKILKRLEKSEMELIQSNADKDKFFSIIAHDLKNPFNAILGFSELVKDELAQNNLEQATEYFGFMRRASIQANLLLENLLLWSRNQNNSLVFKPDRLSLAECISENIRNVEVQALAKHIEIRTKIDEQVYVLADKNMFDTIIRNLLSNAIKFSFESGSIEISTQAGNGNVKILVRDSGVGISPDRLKTLFDRTSVVHTSGTLNEPGSGLGLTLCKEFIEKNGGTITAESTEGSGSVFTISVPLAD